MCKLGGSAGVGRAGLGAWANRPVRSTALFLLPPAQYQERGRQTTQGNDAFEDDRRPPLAAKPKGDAIARRDRCLSASALTWRRWRRLLYSWLVSPTQRSLTQICTTVRKSMDLTCRCKTIVA